MQSTTMILPDRSRAQIDNRWRQDDIAKADLLIIGGGHAAQLAAVAAAGMGFGHVALVGGPEERISGQQRLWANGELLRSFAKARYPDVCFSVFTRDLPTELLREVVQEPDVCIAFCEGTGPASEQIFGLDAPIDPSRRILACVGDAGVRVSVGHQILPIGSGRPATVESALLAAGIALGEARRIVAPCEEDCEPAGAIAFDLPFTEERLPEIHMAGAGGTGSWFGLAAGLMSNSLLIYDRDSIEVSNLPRCPLLNGVGTNKASSLARSLIGLGLSAGQLQPVAGHAGPGWLLMANRRAVAAFCTDSLASRRVLNTAACESGTPAVNLGTALWGASVYAISGSSSCMECRFPDLDKRIETENDEQAANCSRRPEAAAAISNMVAAGAGALVARRLHIPGFAFPGVLHFDAFSPARLWVDSVRKPCGCHGGGSEENCDNTT